jgi:ATPase subunit of ABC transporter with duplicated ATPase domains
MIGKGFGDCLLIERLDFRLPPGGIIGVIGPNGAGKTTLFRLITSQEMPDSGRFRIGETVKLGYIDQSRDALVATNTVWEGGRRSRVDRTRSISDAARWRAVPIVRCSTSAAPISRNRWVSSRVVNATAST